MNESNVAIVVPAAGSGTRMGGRRKQFRTLGGAPVLVRTLEIFEHHPAVDALVVVGPPGEAKALQADLQGYGLTKLHAVAEGGTTRQESVERGLFVLPEETDLVLVHDAVRPFLPADRLSAVIDVARTHGAAALAVPVADTVRRSETEAGASVFGETVPRDGLWRMQTPQAFRTGWLRDAHAAARADGVTGTDEVELVQRFGHAVRLVEGRALTFKITTPADWSLAEALWPVWSGGLKMED
ncbi:MAG: 2-C-methyl-D-erythritol 4-phosphate cytidylyltransferase [Bacteroidota bacterium]